MPAAEHVGSIIVPAAVLIVADNDGAPAIQVGGAGGMRVTVRLAAIGTPTFAQTAPQLFVPGQVRNRLFETINVAEPLSGIGGTGPATDFASTIDLRHAAGLRVQIIKRLPSLAERECAQRSAATHNPAPKTLRSRGSCPPVLRENGCSGSRGMARHYQSEGRGVNGQFIAQNLDRGGELCGAIQL